jgi:NADPH:quinone reductase-like Zn-dependent oxidoreductase
MAWLSHYDEIQGLGRAGKGPGRPGSRGKDRRMRALEFSEYGSPEVLVWGDAPEPHAGPGQIRIAVRAASVNPIDWKMLAGLLSGGQLLAGTGYLGYDTAGVVNEVGEGATGYPWVMRCSAAARTLRRSTRC